MQMDMMLRAFLLVCSFWAPGNMEAEPDPEIWEFWDPEADDEDGPFLDCCEDSDPCLDCCDDSDAIFLFGSVGRSSGMQHSQ